MTETYDFEHPTVALVRDIIKAGRCHGGEADPELGDRLCYTYDGREVDIYLDVSERRLDERGEPYDEALDDDEIIEHTVAVSDCGAPCEDAAAVGEWVVQILDRVTGGSETIGCDDRDDTLYTAMTAWAEVERAHSTVEEAQRAGSVTAKWVTRDGCEDPVWCSDKIDPEADQDMMRPTVATAERIIAEGERVGGMDDDEGDIHRYLWRGREIWIYLTEFGVPASRPYIAAVGDAWGDRVYAGQIGEWVVTDMWRSEGGGWMRCSWSATSTETATAMAESKRAEAMLDSGRAHRITVQWISRYVTSTVWDSEIDGQ